jgi:ketosteroid isomerase-like protein
MRLKMTFALVHALAFLTGFSATLAQGIDPLAVVKRFFAATNAGDADRAMALVGDDPVFVSTQGIERRGRSAMQGFAEALVRENAKIEITTVRVDGNKVIWRNNLTTPSYQKLGVAPIEVNAWMVVERGRIEYSNQYYTLGSIERIERACESPQGQSTQILGRSCSDAAQRVRAHTEQVRATGAPEAND